MEFPAIVYRCPGPHWGPHGTTYDTLAVEDATAFDAALSGGWLPTLQDAAETAAGLRVEAPEAPADDAPPTRAEMEAKASELGIKFDGRTTDARLLAKITDALRASI